MNFAGSQGGPPDANPTAAATLSIKKNGAAAGTVQIATNGTVSFIAASGLALAAGDYVDVYAQTAPDATLAGLGFTLKGTTT